MSPLQNKDLEAVEDVPTMEFEAFGGIEFVDSGVDTEDPNSESMLEDRSAVDSDNVGTDDGSEPKRDRSAASLVAASMATIALAAVAQL